MSKREKILDDIARMAGGTVGLVSDTGKQAREAIRARIDDWAMQMDLVPREDFERLEAMLEKARAEQDALVKRIEELEKHIPGKTKKAGK